MKDLKLTKVLLMKALSKDKRISHISLGAKKLTIHTLEPLDINTIAVINSIAGNQYVLALSPGYKLEGSICERNYESV